MTEFFNGVEIPHFISHKEVQALEIGQVIGELDCRSKGATIQFKDVKFGSLHCESYMFARYIPQPGDYLVFYEDSYKSFSPRAAFVGGYTEKSK